MSAMQVLVLGLGLFAAAGDGGTARFLDPARLGELLQDRQHPLSQSQAALLLVQSRSVDAERVVRQGLRQTESSEVFLALAEALRLQQDGRFTDELLAALASGRPVIRQAAADTLSALAEPRVVLRLQILVEDARTDLAVRQAAVAALGHSGRKSAAIVLLDQLSSKDEVIRQAAASALADLTGQTYGVDVAPWRAWWQRHKDMAEEAWLEERLAFQTCRTRRLEENLERTRGQVIRLNQQLYARMPPADRVSFVQALVDQEDPALRNMAVAWSIELLVTAEVLGQRALTETLLRLSSDGNVEVQRAAVLALGRVNEARAFDRLRLLLGQAPVPVRAAAARALAQQARAPGPEGLAWQRRVIPVLQKALEDPALEVVVEAAEDLGTLGAPEAAPILAVLLRHSSEPVRQTAAQALERVADHSILESLVAALDDTAVTVRFSVVAALGHAAGDGGLLTEAQRGQMVTRLEALLQHDTDPGVRSRAATVLGQCGSPAVLPALWKRVLVGEDNRVQEKAWSAFMEIVVRAGSLDLVQQWDRRLKEAKQAARRAQLLAEVLARWQKREDARVVLVPVTESLVEAHLEQGKWAAAFPLVHELLPRTGSDTEVDKRLRWLLRIGDQALKEGNRAEALRAVQEAQPFLPRSRTLGRDFSRLQKQAQ